MKVDQNYYVVSNGEEPSQIFFTFEEAQSSKLKFIDVFNKQGIWVKAYKLNSDGASFFYTTDF